MICKYVKKNGQKICRHYKKKITRVTFASEATVLFAMKKNSRSTTESDTSSSMILQHGFRMANRA